METITKIDLEKFKVEFFNELVNIMSSNLKPSSKFLSSSEVKEIFHISETKLYELRRDRKIPFIKVDGKYLYDYNEVLNAFKTPGQ